MQNSINLLPWREWKRQREKKQFLKIFMLNVLLVLLVMLVVNDYLNKLMSKEVAQIQSLKQKLIPLASTVQEVKRLANLKAQLLSNRREINHGLTHWRLMLHLLNELNQLNCSGVGLTQLKTDKAQVLLQGYAKSQSHLAQCIKKIETNPWLLHPNLVEIKKIQSKPAPFAYEFRLFVQLNQGGVDASFT